MTKEQAIDLLDNLIGFVEDSQGSDYDETLKMGIESLKQTMWILIKTRPMTEEEEEEYEYKYPYIYDCQLPDDGQDVYVTTRYGNVGVDTFCREYEGCYFETYCDDGDVIAWMPLPESYKAESEEEIWQM